MASSNESAAPAPAPPQFASGSRSLRSLREKLGHLWTKKMLIGVAAGQGVAFLNATTSITSYELARRGINAPTSQSFLNYAMLAIFYGFIIIRRRRWLQMSWYYYVLLAIVDVEANFLVVKAFQYTSLTSVLLLSCFTIPCVIFLTWLFMNTKYGTIHIVGAAICIGGLSINVFSDVHASDRAKGPEPLKGDMIVLAGATLYAFSNVGEEFLVKKGDRIEVMAMLGTFGAVVGAIQISILERKELRSIHWSSGAVIPFLAFSLAMFLIYSTVPTILKIYGAALFNVSLLTSDLWGVLIRIFAYHQKVDYLYFIAYATVAIGIMTYSVAGGKDNTAQVAQATDERDKARDEEARIEGLALSTISSRGTASSGEASEQPPHPVVAGL